jgi:hypothetical protein
VKWSKGFNGSMSMAALLLPLTVAADSHVQTKAASAASAATSHVDFKIIIPSVLYLHVGSANDRTSRGAETVAIMSNNRNVTLNASVRTPESDVHARGSAILSASARKVIAQDALCTVGDAHAAAAAAPTAARGRVNVNEHQLVCTVSMP